MAAPLTLPGGALVGSTVSSTGARLSVTPPGLLRSHPVVLVAGLGAVALVGWYLWKRHAKGGRSARRRSSHPLTRRVKRAPSLRRAGKPIWIG